jgi:hypothetical protein
MGTVLADRRSVRELYDSETLETRRRCTGRKHAPWPFDISGTLRFTIMPTTTQLMIVLHVIASRRARMTPGSSRCLALAVPRDSRARGRT